MLTISLVAELDGRVVGHIAFSPVTMSDGTAGWYGLSHDGVPPEVFFAFSFGAVLPQGTVSFNEAFMVSGPCD